MKEVLYKLFEHKTLDKAGARNVLLDIGKGLYNEQEIASFITAFKMRSVTISELEGFIDALRELSIKISLDEFDPIDIVGTGGDGKNSFNISTLASFVLAGTGEKVAKHGNFSASSVSGSSNLMQELGYKFKTDLPSLKKELDSANICFLHAPAFHPALKIVAPVRKQLGFRTFFNMLGPLVNPASPGRQLIGVHSMELARIYNYLLQCSCSSFAIVHGLDGYDEISLTGDTKIITPDGEFIFPPNEMTSTTVKPEDLQGGNTVKEASGIFIRVLKGRGTDAQNAVVLANAAHALLLTGKYDSYNNALHAAQESLKSGKAFNALKKLIALQ